MSLGINEPIHFRPCRGQQSRHQAGLPEAAVDHCLSSRCSLDTSGGQGRTEPRSLDRGNLWSLCLCSCFCCLLGALRSPHLQKHPTHCHHSNLYPLDWRSPRAGPWSLPLCFQPQTQFLAHSKGSINIRGMKKGMDGLVIHFKFRSISPSCTIRMSFKDLWCIMAKLYRSNKNDQP